MNGDYRPRYLFKFDVAHMQATYEWCYANLEPPAKTNPARWNYGWCGKDEYQVILYDDDDAVAFKLVFSEILLSEKFFDPLACERQ